MSKSLLKHQVIRPQFAVTSIRTVPKAADESSHNFVPRDEPDDAEQLLENVTYAVDDTGIRLHGFTNVDRVHNSVSGTGYRVSGATGDSLYHYVLSPVKRAFDKHPRLETFIMLMSDKGPWMPAPKLHTQKNRTQTMLDDMDRKQIERIPYLPDGGAPLMVARDKILPPWIAVRVDRVLYRHATNQLFNMIMENYKPPRGRRLILDTVDMAAASPRTFDDWMRSDRLICDDFATDLIERTREAIRAGGVDEGAGEAHDGGWRARTSRVVKDLAQAGHIKSVPLLIETDQDGVTTVCLLPNAASTFGEADAGAQFWVDAMQANKQHITLQGARRAARLIPHAVAHYYDEEQLTTNREQASRALPAPASVAERRRKAEEALAQNPDLILHVRSNPTVRALVAPGLPLSDANPCVVPNRGLVMSCDTDFFSLMPIVYAQICYQNPTNPQYCIDNAPILSIGECTVRRTGWLHGASDFVKSEKNKRKRDDEDDDDDEDYDGGDAATEVDEEEQQQQPPVAAEHEVTPIIAHELYDIHRLYHAMLDKCGKDTPDIPHRIRLECILSHAMCFAICGNDFLAGLYSVNRKYTYAGFRAMRGELISFDNRLGSPLLIVPNGTALIKHAYYNSINGARGKKNKPPKPAEQTTYAEINALVARKYKGLTERSTKKHMPDDDRLLLMMQRWQWWIVYASEAWRSVERLLDHNEWGWRPGTTDQMV